MCYFYQDVDVGLDLSKSVLNVFVILKESAQEDEPPENIAIATEGGEVLCDISSVPQT